MTDEQLADFMAQQQTIQANLQRLQNRMMPYRAPAAAGGSPGNPAAAR